MNEKPLSRQHSSDLLLYVLLFLLVSFPLIYSFSIDKHLSADGAHYFTEILDQSDFTYIAWSRQFSNYLTQWPIVLAVKLGLKDIPLLSGFYAVGLYFPYIASYLLCIYAVRRENSFLLVFPLVSILGINLSADYILIGEHHVMTLLSWPILLLLLRKEPLNWLDGWLLWMLLIFFSLSYEAAVIPAIIFSAILGLKLYKRRRIRKQIIIDGIALLLSFAVFAVALYVIVNPRSESNKSNFISATLGILGNKGALVAASFAFFSTLGLLCGQKPIILASLLPITLYGYVLLSNSHGPSASESFNSRTLSLSLLPFLLICAIVSHYCNIKPNRASTRMLVLFVMIMVIGNLRFSGDWKNFRNQVTEIVTVEGGYIPIEETAIQDSPYRWSWNNSQLGIVLSYPCVKAVLLNDPETKWQPFNPREELILKRYVSYDTFFSRVDNDIAVCEQ
ncbi:MAG: hypothetical protein WBB01_24015 [Phormidesmis sp.]